MSSENVLTAPAEFAETFLVNKPVGIRIHKGDCRITNIEPNSGLLGKAFVGDKVVAVDNCPVNKIDELNKKIKESKDNKVSMTIKHGTWSWCVHKCTTVERIVMDKDCDKVTGRAIDIYYIHMKITRTPEITTIPLGLHVKYDARERLMVVGTDKDSITAVHLRNGDIIREVNDKPVASKTMLQFHIHEGIQKDGTLRLLIESASGGGDSYRDTIEMAPDVVDIASKQERKPLF